MDRLKGFLSFVLTLSEIRWWVARIRIQLLDDEEEKKHVKALLVQLLQVAGMGAVAAVVLVNLLLRNGGDNFAPVDLVLPDTDTTQILARSAEVPFNTLAFCNDKEATVELTPPGVVVVENLGRVNLIRGNEIVRWPGNNAQQAAYQVTAVDGKMAPEIPVTMTPEAIKCFVDKGRKAGLFR